MVQMKTENAKERKREEKERKGKDTEMPGVYLKRFLHKAPPCKVQRVCKNATTK